MQSEATILIAEDDDGHATLIKKNLRRAGVLQEIIHFHDGQEALDFLFKRSTPHLIDGHSYVLLCDIRMPKVDGIEVLRQVKADPQLRTIPVVMITTTDDPKDVDQCHVLGCSNYITKPVDYDRFVHSVQQLGVFLSMVEVPMSEK
jgi:CheY-like chemotaxis protein